MEKIWNGEKRRNPIKITDRAAVIRILASVAILTALGVLFRLSGYANPILLYPQPATSTPSNPSLTPALPAATPTLVLSR